MSLKQEHLEAIVVSVLAVNRYPLEKSYSLLPNLRKLGLTDPTKVANANSPDVMMRLDRAGYHRGLLTEMMAGRLIGLMNAVSEGQLDSLSNMVTKGEKDQAKQLLCRMKGIGPQVAADVWMLVTSNAS